MNANVRDVLMQAEVARIARWIRRCELEPLYPHNNSLAPILACENCERRAAPGQIYCVDCLHPDNVGDDGRCTS